MAVTLLKLCTWKRKAKSESWEIAEKEKEEFFSSVYGWFQISNCWNPFFNFPLLLLGSTHGWFGKEGGGTIGIGFRNENKSKEMLSVM